MIKPFFEIPLRLLHCVCTPTKTHPFQSKPSGKKNNPCILHCEKPRCISPLHQCKSDPLMHAAAPPFIIQDPIPGRLPAAVPESYCPLFQSALSSTLTLSCVFASPPLSSLLCQLTVGSQSQSLSARDQSGARAGPRCASRSAIQYTSSLTPPPRTTTTGTGRKRNNEGIPTLCSFIIQRKASRRTLNEIPGGQSSGTPRL